ncbi:MAG: fatty acid desaturase [Planctomycetota bacterium]|nr:MAG: fatty acid desaturase [Planctomycetota bacterium]
MKTINQQTQNLEIKKIPNLSELGRDLLYISPLRLAFTLIVPFVCTALFFIFAYYGYWALSVLSLMYLSFVSYGSISHDLVHRNIGLSKRLNEMLLCSIELLALRSGHAYRLVHLHHHASYPSDDDIEGAASRMSLLGSLFEGITLQVRIHIWAIRRRSELHVWIVIECLVSALIVISALIIFPYFMTPLLYVVLMIMGSWIIPLITSYIPHNPKGISEIEQTLRFRGIVLSIIALRHLYHLEHHLYPSIPHHNWHKLAKRLDPYLDEHGINSNKLWF